MNKAVDNDIAWSCGGVMPDTLHDNMFSGLNISFATWATSGEMGEKSLSVFSNRSMSSSHVSKLST